MSKSGPCIYALTDPCGMIRYIGQAKSFKKRLGCHLRPSGKRGDTAREKWLRGLEAREETPGALVLCYSDDLDADETRLIAKYRSMGAPLVNMADGGKLMGHASRARAKSQWAGLQTPIQRMLCAISFGAREAKRRGDSARAEHLAGRAIEVRDRLAVVRRTKGRAGIERINSVLAQRHPWTIDA